MKAYLWAICAVLCWSFNVIVANVLIDILTPWQIAGLRWCIASILIFPFFINILKQNIKVILKHKKWIFWTAFWGITISNTCVYYAAYTVKPVTLSLIGATGPLFLILFARIFNGTKLRLHQIMGLLITLFGVGLIVMHARSNTMSIGIQPGDWWMLGTAITFGFYSFRVANKPKELSHMTLLMCCLVVGAIMCLPLFIYDTINNPLNFYTNFTENVIWIMLFMGVFNSLIAYLLWNKALELGDTVHIGMTYYLMPVFSAVESWVILSETLSIVHLVGALTILCGIVITNKKFKSA